MTFSFYFYFYIPHAPSATNMSRFRDCFVVSIASRGSKQFQRQYWRRQSCRWSYPARCPTTWSCNRSSTGSCTGSCTAALYCDFQNDYSNPVHFILHQSSVQTLHHHFSPGFVGPPTYRFSLLYVFNRWLMSWLCICWLRSSVWTRDNWIDVMWWDSTRWNNSA